VVDCLPEVGFYFGYREAFNSCIMEVSKIEKPGSKMSTSNKLVLTKVWSKDLSNLNNYSQSDNPVSGNTLCPLCTKVVKDGEDGWREHLMYDKGCSNNERRPGTEK